MPVEPLLWNGQMNTAKKCQMEGNAWSLRRHCWKFGSDPANYRANPQSTKLKLDTGCNCETCPESKLLIISRSAARTHIKMQNEIQIEKAVVKSSPSSITLQFDSGNRLTGSFHFSGHDWANAASWNTIKLTSLLRILEERFIMNVLLSLHSLCKPH